MTIRRDVAITLAVGALAATFLAAIPATATPTYYLAWVNHYPDSTLPEHMALTAGNQCFTCHHPPIGVDGSCYREDLKALLHQSYTIQEAITMLDGVDSDGDGIPNGVEFRTPRTDAPGMIGYHAGLIGPTGTDPCSPDEPNLAITNTSETPCLADWDRSNAINSGDISAYLTAWYDAVLSSNPDAADFNFDGAVNASDISAFLTAWLSAAVNGC